MENSRYYGDSRKQKKLAGRRAKIIQTNARVLHKLTKKMRPLWRKELEELNLSPDNTTIDFTDSMQAEVRHAIRSHILKEPLDDNTVNELTDEVYRIARERQNSNKSVGHIIMGVPAMREPLLSGTVRVRGGGLGEYHLRYRPLDDPESTRELNGTIRLHDLRLDLTHRSAATKLLRNILTVRPRELTYGQADRALAGIFTTPATGREHWGRQATAMQQRPAVTAEPQLHRNQLETKATTSVTTRKANEHVTLQSKLRTDLTKDESNLVVDETETPGVVMTSTKAASEVFKVQTSYFEELNKLRETISISRNISSILMEEIEARERETSTGMGGRKKPEEKGAMVGNWKLQQRIRDFRPGRPYPTMPPFIRRWPTFRSQSLNISVATESGSSLPSLLTMRPKYKGPRHEPFFFNDFRRIRTVYPTTAATEQLLETTQVSLDSGFHMETEMAIPEKTTTSSPKADIVPTKFNMASVESTYITFKSTKTPLADTTELGFKQSTNREELSRNYKVTHPTEETSSRKIQQFQAQPHLSERDKIRRHNTRNIVKQWNYVTTERPYFMKLNVSGRMHTIRPVFSRLPTAPPAPLTPATPPATTARRSHYHAIKHHVKKGFQKIFNIFGFGKSKKEDREQ